MIDAIAALIAPILGAAMEAGELALPDPLAVAHGLVRMCLSYLLAPPRRRPGHLAVHAARPRALPSHGGGTAT